MPRSALLPAAALCLLFASAVPAACGSDRSPGPEAPAALTAAIQATVPAAAEPGRKLRVLATETFLADMARNVAGDRATVEALLPYGLDPHSFEPTPSDLRKVAEADLLVVNGGGVEGYLDTLLASAGGERPVVVASEGLPSRRRQAGEPTDASASGAPGKDVDPHFWLDPVLGMAYVATLRDGLTRADPAGAGVFAVNAEAYTQRLAGLDAELRLLVGQVPEDARLLVTNHDSLGYFADRYGFRIVGTVLPSVSTDASPSAKELAELVDRIRATGAPAIFLETGADPRLAQQVADEAGVKLVTDLYLESTSAPDGPAPTYVDMLRADAEAIVTALRGSP